VLKRILRLNGTHILRLNGTRILRLNGTHIQATFRKVRGGHKQHR